jgi:hypothetical protein
MNGRSTKDVVITAARIAKGDRIMVPRTTKGAPHGWMVVSAVKPIPGGMVQIKYRHTLRATGKVLKCDLKADMEVRLLPQTPIRDIVVHEGVAYKSTSADIKAEAALFRALKARRNAGETITIPGPNLLGMILSQQLAQQMSRTFILPERES